jgi:hypothetical protein
MENLMMMLKHMATLAVAFALAACGGGGGDSSPAAQAVELLDRQEVLLDTLKAGQGTPQDLQEFNQAIHELERLGARRYFDCQAYNPVTCWDRLRELLTPRG